MNPSLALVVIGWTSRNCEWDCVRGPMGNVGNFVGEEVVIGEEAYFFIFVVISPCCLVGEY